MGYTKGNPTQEDAMTTPVRTIKKYPNRRLYDTANSGYITLVDVKQMVLEQIDFQVIDAKSGEDLTRAILLQIILEEESGGLPMFSSPVECGEHGVGLRNRAFRVPRFRR